MVWKSAMTSPDFERGSWGSFVPIASTSMIFAAGTVAAGRAVRDEEIITPKLATAGVVLLLGLTFLNQIDQLFAGAMALLILVVTFLEYGPDILTYVGVNLNQDS
jgi:hypothetical protein